MAHARQLAAQLVQSAVAQHLALVQDEHRGDQVLEQRQQVGADDEGGAGGGMFADQFLHGADAARIGPGERLIEEDGPRLVQPAAAGGQLLPHAARQIRGQRVAFLRQFQPLSSASARPAQSRRR